VARTCRAASLKSDGVNGSVTRRDGRIGTGPKQLRGGLDGVVAAAPLAEEVIKRRERSEHPDHVVDVVAAGLCEDRESGRERHAGSSVGPSAGCAGLRRSPEGAAPSCASSHR